MRKQENAFNQSSILYQLTLLSHLLPPKLWHSLLYLLMFQHIMAREGFANAQTNCAPKDWRPSMEPVELGSGAGLIGHVFPHHVSSGFVAARNEVDASEKEGSILAYTWVTQNGIAIKTRNYFTGVVANTQHIPITHQDPMHLQSYPRIVGVSYDKYSSSNPQEFSHRFILSWSNFTSGGMQEEVVSLNLINPVSLPLEMIYSDHLVGRDITSLTISPDTRYGSMAYLVRNLTSSGHSHFTRVSFFSGNGNFQQGHVEIDAAECGLTSAAAYEFVAGCMSFEMKAQQNFTIHQLKLPSASSSALWQETKRLTIPDVAAVAGREVGASYIQAAFLEADGQQRSRYAALTTEIENYLDKNNQESYKNILSLTTYTFSEGKGCQTVTIDESEAALGTLITALQLIALDEHHMVAFWIRGDKAEQNIFMAAIDDQCNIIISARPVASITGSNLAKEAVISAVLPKPEFIDLSWNAGLKGVHQKQIGLFGRVCGLTDSATYNEDDEYIFSNLQIEAPEFYQIHEKVTVTVALKTPGIGRLKVKTLNGIELTGSPNEQLLSLNGTVANLNNALPTVTFVPNAEVISAVELSVNAMFKLNQASLTTRLNGQLENDPPVLQNEQIVLPLGKEVIINNMQLLLTDDTISQAAELHYRISLIQGVEVYKKTQSGTQRLAERGEFTQADINNGDIIFKGLMTNPVLELIYFERNTPMPQTALVSLRFIGLPRLMPQNPIIRLNQNDVRTKPVVLTTEDITVTAEGVLNDEVIFTVENVTNCRFVVDGVEKRRTPFTFAQSDINDKKVSLFYLGEGEGEGEGEAPELTLSVMLLGIVTTKTPIPASIQFMKTPNNKPTSMNPEAIEVTAETFFSRDIAAFFNDLDGDILTYTIERVEGDAAKGLSIERNILRGTIEEPGHYKIYITASDGEEKSAPAIIEIVAKAKTAEALPWLETTRGIIITVASGVTLCGSVLTLFGCTAKNKKDQKTRVGHEAVNLTRKNLKKPWCGWNVSNFKSDNGTRFIDDVLSLTVDMLLDTQSFKDNNIFQKLGELVLSEQENGETENQENDETENNVKGLIQKVMQLGHQDEYIGDYYNKKAGETKPSANRSLKFLLDNHSAHGQPNTPFEYLYNLNVMSVLKDAGLESGKKYKLEDLVNILKKSLEEQLNEDLKDKDKKPQVESLFDIVTAVMNAASDGKYASGITSGLCCFSSYKSARDNTIAAYNPEAMHKDARKLLKLKAKPPLIPSIIISAVNARLNKCNLPLLDEDALAKQHADKYQNAADKVSACLEKLLDDPEILQLIKPMDAITFKKLKEEGGLTKKFSNDDLKPKLDIKSVELLLYRSFSLSNYQLIEKSFVKALENNIMVHHKTADKMLGLTVFVDAEYKPFNEKEFLESLKNIIVADSPLPVSNNKSPSLEDPDADFSDVSTDSALDLSHQEKNATEMRIMS